MLLMSAPLRVWVGVVTFGVSVTRERTTLLGTSCSQPLPSKQHLLGEGSSSSHHHDNINELQLLIHLVGESLF